MYQELNEGSKHMFIKKYKHIFRCDNCNKELNQNDKVFYCDEADKLLCGNCYQEIKEE